jgi:hypothetical protein
VRRAQLRRRRAGLAAGAAVGAFALAAPAAQAANFEVNTLGDSHAADGCTTDPNGCTLRDAVAAADLNSTADTITFHSGLSGTVRLLQGEIATGTTHADPITIQGPGANLLTISGDKDDSGTPTAGDSRIFNVSAVSTAQPSLALSGLKLSGGDGSGNGGAIFLGDYAHLSLAHTTLTGNTATNAGGAVGTNSEKYNAITVTDSTISGNNAPSGGAISAFGPLTIDNSTISGNHATAGGGGGVFFGAKYGPLEVTDSVISGNSATTVGGGLILSPISTKYYGATDNKITNTTISGNSATTSGAGIFFAGLASADGSFKISHSTISGNPGGVSSYGGGIQFGGIVNGTFQLLDSTISGNSAGTGAGVSFHPASTTADQIGPDGSVSFYNSTIASNTAAAKGGGFYLGEYGPSGGPYSSASIPLNSTIVGDNKANGSSNDLDQANTATSGGFELFLSLVEAPGTYVLTAAGSIIGSDPQLGALANNGGPTQTKLPAVTSPAIDAGGNIVHLATDQRGDPRTVDLGPPDATDGTDIGAVELGAPPPPAGPGPATGQPPGQTKKKCKKHKKHKRSAQSAKKKCKKKKKKG